MKFKRHIKWTEREISPQKIAASKKAILRDRDRCGLFPEMMVFKSVDERLSYFKEQNKLILKKRRDSRARLWREARRKLNALTPIQKRGVIYVWNFLEHMPHDPAYLLTMINSVEAGEIIWARAKRYKQLQLVGAGRLDRYVVFKRINKTGCK